MTSPEAARSAPMAHASAPSVAVVGGGPAGLMAAETLALGGAKVDLFDAMPSVGRKFLLAGKGGLNLTHSEPLDRFVARYGERAPTVSRWLDALTPLALRDWARELGVETFVGSSGRVFPVDMKAAPLLRAWLHRLRTQGVRFHMRHRWLGWAEGASPLGLRFAAPTGDAVQTFDAVVLALGGASWSRLGSDGAWWPWLAARGVELAPLVPANCGFELAWSDYFRQRFAGTPIKTVRLRFEDARGRVIDQAGEFVVSDYGVEGSLVYAASALLRDEIAVQGHATLQLDLVPGRDEARLAAGLAQGRGARSLPNHLREHAGLDGAKAALLRERWSADELARLVAHEPATLAHELKHWPLTLEAPRPIDEAISTAGGVRLEALDEGLMLRVLPGVFACGEMLDWEAPTGGYLLSASFASGRVAGDGVLAWCADRHPTPDDQGSQCSQSTT